MSKKKTLQTAFSTPAEIHAFVHGFFNGLFEHEPEMEYPDSVDEPHYFRGGYIAGWLLDWKYHICDNHE